MVGIYKIVSPSGSIYIGQSIFLENRIKSYEYEKCKTQRKLYNSIIKYGWKNHKVKILHELPSDVDQIALNAYEFLYWELYKSCKFNMLNIREPGHSGKISEESKRKISKKNTGRKLTLDQIEKRSKSFKCNYYCISEEERRQKYPKRFTSGGNSRRAKKVDQYDKIGNFIKTWDCIMDIKRSLGISSTHISAVCKNKRSSAGGYKFIYHT